MNRPSTWIALLLGVVATVALILRSFQSPPDERAGATQPERRGAEVAQKQDNASSNAEVSEPVTASEPVHAEPGKVLPMHQQVAEVQKTIGFKEQSDALFDLMNGASLEEVRQLLDLSEDELEFSSSLRSEMMVAAFERWYHLDPVAAIRAMDASALSPSRKETRMEVYLEDWTSRSPRAVQAFLAEGELTGVSADLVYGAVARGSASGGHRAMFEDALGNIREPEKRLFTLKSIARTLQRDHEEVFEAWLPTLPPEDRKTAIAEGAWMLADQDMDRALDRLDQLKELGADELPVTRSRVVVKWARNDPAKAGQWVLNQELSDEERESLFSLAFRVWMSKDRDAAAAWAESSIEQGKFDEAFMNRIAAGL